MEEAAGFAGDQVCAGCHEAEFRDHARSRHARTLDRADAPGLRGPFNRREVLAVRSYRFETDHADGPLIRVRSGAGKAVGRVRFALGSGKDGRTFLVENDAGELLEAHPSYYSGMRRWHLTPGHEETTPQDEPLGRVLTAKGADDCLLCHSTLLVRRRGETYSRCILPGVGCESCHGPRAAHVRAMNASEPAAEVEQVLPDAESIVQSCGRCHRAYLPGQRFIKPDPPQLARLQGMALQESRCYQQSRGELSCLTCHSPHTDAVTQTAFYDAACARCHSGTTASPACRAGQTRNCVSCHMPLKSSSLLPPGVRFHHHRIGVFAK